MNKIYSIIILLSLLLSCSREKPTGAVSGSSQKSAAGGAPYALELTPKDASRKTTLNLVAAGFNLADAKIEWLVNGRPFTTLVPLQFNGSDAAKGDSVQARAVVGGREVRSNVVQIMNAPPEIIKLKILPEVFKPDDTLNVEAEGSDIDGDGVSFVYEWTKNGELAGKGPRIETPVKRGNKVSVKVTPFDGENYGGSVVLNRDIQNLPPVITENNEFTFDGKIYTYQVKATDPDGDALRYSLEVSPNGMTIDQSTGLITWPVPPDFKGEIGTIAVVDDGHGGIARYNLKITIK